MYSKQELQEGLSVSLIGNKIFTFETIDSTNSCAKTLAEAGMEEGTVVLTDFQSAGRGRLGRTWLSEPGKNLLFSFILRPAMNSKDAGTLSLFAAAGVAQGIESFTGMSIECKWPNDLLLRGKKVCGILLESSFSADKLDYAVIGIGINVNQTLFDSGLLQHSTSLKTAAGTALDRKALFQNILRSLDSLYAQIQNRNNSGIMKEWLSRNSMIGKQTTVVQDAQKISGIVQAFSEDGSMILKTSKGLQSFYSGDVTLDTTEK
jgi:BirA family biotin operon repressor/biotin-[acetyl-CoA-carboxylase] ligase